MNDRASRADERKPGSAVAPWPAEEELETGEPIPEDEEPRPAKKKIAALRGKFQGKPSSQTEPAEPAEAASGQMVLSSAKYLTPDEYNTDTPENRKKLAQRRKAQEAKESGGQSLEGKVFHSGFWGGLLAMVVAVLWFVVGLMDDVIFFYPPILFVIGLGAVFKGGMKGEE